MRVPVPHARLPRLAVPACALALALAAAPVSAYDWLQFNGDPSHAGNNPLEKAIDRNNVATMTRKFQVALPAPADIAPVLLRSVTTPSGVRDLLFVTTRAGHIVALDARTGASVWSKQYGAGACKINNGASSGPCYTTSAPAIDPTRQFVYSYGLDGYVHKYAVGDGTEITTGGWPQLTTLKAFDEKSAGALAFATSQGRTYLYAVHGGYPGDQGDYQGHVTTIDLASGAQKVFNTNCSNQTVHLARLPATPNCAAPRSAVWSRPSVIYYAALDRIYAATGNGTYTGNSGGFDWSESIVALTPDGVGAGGKPLDAYTPTNFQSLDTFDADLGSTAPAILPVPGNSAVQHLALQGGKDAKLRLVNLQNLSGVGGPGNVGGEIGPILNVQQGGQVYSQPAVWVNPGDSATWAFVTTSRGISGVKLSISAAGAPSIATQWSKTQGGGSPLVANGLVYYAGNDGVRAVDPLTGATLWNAAGLGSIHWQSPVVANGWLYVTDESSQLTAFAPTVVPTDTDFDFGGTADLLWRSSSDGSTLMSLMNGAQATITVTLQAPAVWSVINVGDFNGDDKADLLWRNSATGQIAIWLMNGTAYGSGAIINANPQLNATHIADFNGDRKSDLIVRDISTGQTWMWLMSGFTVTSTALLQAPAEWSVTHTGDFNGDGKSDLVWRNSVTGETAIWLMDGSRYLGGARLQAPAEWSITHIADFNGDGKSDLVWHNAVTGESAIWLMDGVRYLAGIRPPVPRTWSVTHIVDFDGDGRSDIVWRDAATGQTITWLMDGMLFGSGGPLSNDPNMKVTNIGDFDGDGKSDLILRNTATGATEMWLMNGAVPRSTTTLTGDATLTVANPR